MAENNIENSVENSIIVEGYAFSDRNMAAQARKEAEGVRYVRSKADLNKPDQVFMVYHRLLDQKMFQTPVGYTYLKELQEYLKTMPGIHEEDIRPIPVARGVRREDSGRMARIWKHRIDHVKGQLRTSRVLNVAFLVIIVAMFVINLTSGQANILNYENEIQNKYSDWKQELQEREARVREKELQLQIGDSILDDEEAGTSADVDKDSLTEGSGEIQEDTRAVSEDAGGESAMEETPATAGEADTEEAPIAAGESGMEEDIFE